MKKRRILAAVCAAALVVAGFGPLTMNSDAASSGSQDMYRLYNRNSGEHFYTAKAEERDSLVKAGWNYEGIGWVAPVSSNTPVYRLYNGSNTAGDHHYTMDKSERDGLIARGWKDEGIGWYSDDAKKVPLYREYNPNARTGTHNYTTGKAEHDKLVAAGWKNENIGWYALEGGRADNSYVPPTPNLHTSGMPGFKYAGIFECSDSQVGSSKPRLILDDDGYCELYAVYGANNMYKYMGYYEYGPDTSEYSDQGTEIKLYLHFPGEDASHQYAEAQYDGEVDGGYIYFETPGFGIMGGNEYYAGYFSRVY